jgi:hypothetical protein
MLRWRTLLLLIMFATLSSGVRITSKAIHKAKGFSWNSYTSSHFDIFFEAASVAERESQKIAGLLEKFHAGLETLLGIPLPERTEYFLVSSRARMKELVGFEANAANNGPVSLGVYNETTRAIGLHEICHWQARNAWGPSKGLWVNEGLAVYSDNQWNGRPLHLVAKWLLDHGKLAPLTDLVRNGWEKKYSDLITYPELGSFVKFVYERYGRESVKTLWQRGPDGATASTGKALNELDREWRAEIAKLDASSIKYSL